MVSDGLETILASANKALKLERIAVIGFLLALILAFAEPIFFALAAAFAAKTDKIIFAYEHFEDAFQIFFGNLLPLGNLLQGNKLPRPMLSKVDHHAQRIAPFGGNDHIRVLPLMSIEC